MRYVRLETILYYGKQNIPWEQVEDYMKRYSGKPYTVRETHDRIRISSSSANEYAESKYTKSLRGSIAKVKANVVQILPELIESSVNRRWSENKDPKHAGDASRGWFRYDTYFAVPVQAENEEKRRWNYYKGTIVIRVNDRGLFFYDLVDIKKEARTPREP